MAQNMTADDAQKLLQAAAEDRRATIRECVTWLAQNHAQYKPEFLAGEMANELLTE